MSTIDLQSHTVFQKIDTVNKICKPLFQSSVVEYFCYHRRYPNGDITLLASQKDCASYFYEDGVYPETWIVGIPFDHFKTGIIFWSVAREFDTEAADAISKTMAGMGLAHGVDVVQKFDDYCDFFCFSSGSIDIYHCNAQYLNQFIVYFKQESRSILQAAYQNKIVIPDQDFHLNQLPIFDLDASTAQADFPFRLKRFYLSGLLEDVYFTEAEMNTLCVISTVGTVKGTAEKLHMSPRTVEHHVANMKKKVHCSLLVELIHIARAGHVLPL